jgi:hypothetical protein
LGKSVSVEVIGVNPPCARCDATWKNVEKAVTAVKSEGIEAIARKVLTVPLGARAGDGKVPYLSTTSLETMSRMGRVPDPNEIDQSPS